mgnify:CR=1 FL=1
MVEVDKHCAKKLVVGVLLVDKPKAVLHVTNRAGRRYFVMRLNIPTGKLAIV